MFPLVQNVAQVLMQVEEHLWFFAFLDQHSNIKCKTALSRAKAAFYMQKYSFKCKLLNANFNPHKGVMTSSLPGPSTQGKALEAWVMLGGSLLLTCTLQRLCSYLKVFNGCIKGSKNKIKLTVVNNEATLWEERKKEFGKGKPDSLTIPSQISFLKFCCLTDQVIHSYVSCILEPSSNFSSASKKIVLGIRCTTAIRMELNHKPWY